MTQIVASTPSLESKGCFERSIQVQIFLLACLPMLIGHHARPIQTFYPELLAVLIGLGLIATVAWRYGLAFGPTVLSPLLWIGLIGVQALAGRTLHAHDVLGFSGFVLWAVLLAAALRHCVNRLPEGSLSSAFAAGLLAGATYNALAVILQVSVGDLPGIYYPFDGSVVGNIGQRNLLTVYLMLGVVSAIQLYGAQRLPRFGMLAVIVFLTFSLVLAGGRSIVVYMAWLAASLLLVPGLIQDRRRTLGIVAAVAAIIFWELMHPWVIEVLAVPGESITGRFQTQGALDGARQNLLMVAWQQILTHPLLGAGLGSFDQLVFWQALPADGSLRFLSNVEHAHNILAHLAAELGLLALIPLGVLAVALLRRMRADCAVGWWSGVAPGLLILHAMIEYPLWYAHYLGLFACLMAFSLPAGRWQLNSGAGLKLGVAIGLLAALLGMVWLERDYRRLETYPEARLPPVQVFQTFNAIAANPLIGQHARAFLAGNLNPAPVRIPEKLALCQRALSEFVDEAVIMACLPIFDLAGLPAMAQALRERLARNEPRQQPGR